MRLSHYKKKTGCVFLGPAMCESSFAIVYCLCKKIFNLLFANLFLVSCKSKRFLSLQYHNFILFCDSLWFRRFLLTFFIRFPLLDITIFDRRFPAWTSRWFTFRRWWRRRLRTSLLALFRFWTTQSIWYWTWSVINPSIHFIKALSGNTDILSNPSTLNHSFILLIKVHVVCTSKLHHHRLSIIIFLLFILLCCIEFDFIFFFSPLSNKVFRGLFLKRGCIITIASNFEKLFHRTASPIIFLRAAVAWTIRIVTTLWVPSFKLCRGKI